MLSLLILFASLRALLETLLSPIPATQWDLRCRRQREIEEAAKIMMNRICQAETNEQVYNLVCDVNEFGATWGDSEQVTGWTDSMFLELHNRQQQINSHAQLQTI